jgi:hypothetical protein
MVTNGLDSVGSWPSYLCDNRVPTSLSWDSNITFTALDAVFKMGGNPIAPEVADLMVKAAKRG